MIDAAAEEDVVRPTSSPKYRWIVLAMGFLGVFGALGFGRFRYSAILLSMQEDLHIRSWDRVIELWYETFSDWRSAVVEEQPHYTAPSWATNPEYPFVKPFEDLVSSFILERPTAEFLPDLRAYMP